MAGKKGRRDAAPRRAPKRPAKPGSTKPARPQPKPSPSPRPRADSQIPQPVDGPTATAPFRLGAVPGATPGKWIDTWHERMPRIPLILTPIAVAGQRRALLDDEVDAALVRLPVDDEGLHTIPLYEEVAVVVASIDSHLTVADELDLADLAGEVLITPVDDVLGIDAPGTLAPKFDAPETTEDAIATVAAGVGIVIVPMSLARLHHRKDVTYRPLRGGPTSTVALAWVADRTTTSVETFIGVVRGRTANSSRG